MEPEEFLENVDEEFLCSICTNVLKNPHSCQQGHTFCLDCITQWLQNKSSCPSGRKALKVSQLTKVRPMENMINRLMVRCVNADVKNNRRKRRKLSASAAESEGCSWTGRLQDRERHSKTCNYALVNCSKEGCTTTVWRQDLKTHEETCPCRCIPCTHCAKEVIARKHVYHVRRCDAAPVACAYGARVTLPLLSVFCSLSLLLWCCVSCIMLIVHVWCCVHVW